VRNWQRRQSALKAVRLRDKLREGTCQNPHQPDVELAKRLRFYPNVPDLKIERCGDGLKLEVEHPSIGQQG